MKLLKLHKKRKSMDCDDQAKTFFLFLPKPFYIYITGDSLKPTQTSFQMIIYIRVCHKKQYHVRFVRLIIVIQSDYSGILFYIFYKYMYCESRARVFQKTVGKINYCRRATPCFLLNDCFSCGVISPTPPSHLPTCNTTLLCNWCYLFVYRVNNRRKREVICGDTLEGKREIICDLYAQVTVMGPGRTTPHRI